MRFAMRPDPTLCQRLTERAWHLIVRRDVDLIEIASDILMLGWGVQLLMPWETFRTGIGYAVLGQLMSEVAWGVLLTWSGVTQIGAYLLDQWRVRLASALGACMAWAFLSVAFGFSNPYGTGIIVYPFLALVSALVFWRVLTHRIER